MKNSLKTHRLPHHLLVVFTQCAHKAWKTKALVVETGGIAATFRLRQIEGRSAVEALKKIENCIQNVEVKKTSNLNALKFVNFEKISEIS